MNNYSKLPPVESNSSDELIRVKHQLDQALSLIDDLRVERDDANQRYTASLREVEILERKLQDKEKRVDGLFTELQWIRKILYNPTFKPVEKDVLISSHDHARSGDEVRIYVGTKAVQIGVARNTYGGTLQKLGEEFHVIEYRNTEPKRDGKGKISEEVYVRFPEQLLKNPDEIVIDRGPEKRGGNAKEKAAKKACPNCNSIQLEEGKVCYCKNCNHQWEEGKRKDVNFITPADEMRESANTATREPRSSLFEEFEKQPEPEPEQQTRPHLHIVKDPKFPDRNCFKCGTREWVWDETFDMPKCGRCG